jgi:transcriptional regulator with XRE-family HTH domain
MSQQALAEALGVTRSAVSNWESSGSARPATDRLAMLASALQVSFEWVATGRGDMSLPGGRGAATVADAAAVVDCPHELHLLQAYRRAPDRVKVLLQDMARLHAPPLSRARLPR